MKKLRFILVLLVCLVPTFSVLAETIDDEFKLITGEEVSSENDVNGSSIIAGNDVTSSNSVKGIDMLFGNNVNYKSNSDYALLAGNNVNVFGTVNNDGFIFGNSIIFDSSVVVERDLFVFGNSVVLSGKFNRDITIYASSVTVDDASIIGNLTIYTGNLEVKEATVQGKLSYNKDAEATISSDAVIGSTVLSEEMVKEVTFQDRVWEFITNYCGTLIIFVAFALIVPAMFKRLEQNNENSNAIGILSLLGYGALGLIAFPLIFIVLCYFVLGMPLAILLLVLYILFIWLSSIFTGYLYGYLIWKKWIKKELNVLLVGLVGITVNTIIIAIPVIGGLFAVVSLMLGMGLILQLFKRTKKDL